MLSDIERTMQEGRWEEARTALQDFVFRHPENPQGHAYLGLCSFHFGDLETAADQLKRAFALEPHYWEAAKKLMICYDRLGRYKDALDVAREVARLRPSDQEISKEVERLEELLNSGQATKPIVFGI
jgi:Flp pilus assembly protein TadD